MSIDADLSAMIAHVDAQIPFPVGTVWDLLTDLTRFGRLSHVGNGCYSPGSRRAHAGRASPTQSPVAGAPAVPPSGTARCVSKWKQYRAVATRYDKRDYIFTGTLTATAILS